MSLSVVFGAKPSKSWALGETLGCAGKNTRVQVWRPLYPSLTLQSWTGYFQSLWKWGVWETSNNIHLLLKQPVSPILQTVKLSKKKSFFLWKKRIMYFYRATETKTEVEGLGSGPSFATS